MISPSSALGNWLRGTSTFLLIPRMSVNCSRRKSTPYVRVRSRMSSLPAPARSVGSPARPGRSVAPDVRALACAMPSSPE